MRQLLRRFVVVCSALVFTPFSYADTVSVAGQVQVVVGSVRLIDSSGKEFGIERGTELKQGDRIVTEEGALVQVRLSDGSLISVRTNTDITFREYRFDPEGKQEPSLVMNLVKGALRSITGLIGKRNPSGYKVMTPTATVGIRGTDHEPVFIPEPKPGDIPLGLPGTYDKVNSGETFIQTQAGLVNVRPGQVGFVPIVPGVAPKLLPAVPEFFRKLDPKGDTVSKAMRQGTERKLPVRQLNPALVGTSVKAEVISTGAPPPSTSTLSTTTLAPMPSTLTSPTTTLTTTTLSPTTSTLISPTTSTLSTTTLSPTTSTLSTTISPTLSTTISPTLSTTTISPTLSTTTISPTLSTTTISPTLSTTTISPTLSTTTLSPTPILSPTTTFSTTPLIK